MIYLNEGEICPKSVLLFLDILNQRSLTLLGKFLGECALSLLIYKKLYKIKVWKIILLQKFWHFNPL